MDLIWRFLVFVRAIIYGSGLLIGMFCRSIMVVCMPRVLRVRALRLWCVYMGFVVGRVLGKEKKKKGTKYLTKGISKGHHFPGRV